MVFDRSRQCNCALIDGSYSSRQLDPSVRSGHAFSLSIMSLCGMLCRTQDYIL